MAFYLDNTRQIILVTIIIVSLLPSTSQSFWLFQQQQENPTGGQEQQLVVGQDGGSTKTAPAAPGYFSQRFSGYGTKLLSIAGIQPASIANLLNTVGDTGFRYFNIQDQCRNRAACDLGFILFKKLSFLHNWLIRTSVRTLTDMNNIYTQSWMDGMLGHNCTLVYAACRESPLEGLMNLAMLQQLTMSNSGLVGQTNAATVSGSVVPLAPVAQVAPVAGSNVGATPN